MQRLLKSDIYAAPRPTAEVEVPGWGGSVTIVALSAGDLEEWRQAQAKVDVEPGLGVAMLVMLSVLGSDGRMFDVPDLGFLKVQPPVVLKPLIDAILKLNGLDAPSREDVAGN